MSSLQPIKEERNHDNDDDDTEFDDDDDEMTLSEYAVLRARQFSVRFLKGFGSGLGVYTGIKVVTSLMRNPFRER